MIHQGEPGFIPRACRLTEGADAGINPFRPKGLSVVGIRNRLPNPMSSSIARIVLPLLVLAGTCHGQSDEVAPDRLMAALRDSFSFSPLPPLLATEPTIEPVDEDANSILHLETMKVTATTGFHRDLLEAAKRAAAVREAAKFSPLTGGLIYSMRVGFADLDVGVWTFWAPHRVESLHRQDPMLWAQIFRLRW